MTNPMTDQRCETMEPIKFPFYEPTVLADPDGYSVLIPGSANPAAIVAAAIATMNDYGLPIDCTDKHLDAEVRINEHVRFHRCSNPDHAFHPEFGVPSIADGAVAASRVTFTRNTIAA